MRYGFVLPGGLPGEQLEQAVLAEEAGWDGVFVFETAYGVDPWSLLAAMAARTETVRLGTMLTPLPWRRPWKVASQALTLDHLSAGRAILAVGLGAVDDALGSTGEVTDRRTRAELLDEGLEVIDELWAGRFHHQGRHFQVDLRARSDVQSLRPVQRPRIPIWVVGGWPRERSMNRVLRYDGLLPNVIGEEAGPPTPDDVAEMRAWLDERGGASIDIVAEGETEPGEAVTEWADAGATWWLETRWTAAEDDRVAVVRRRLEGGPPR